LMFFWFFAAVATAASLQVERRTVLSTGLVALAPPPPKTKKAQADIAVLSPKVLPRAIRLRVNDADQVGRFLEKALSMTAVDRLTYAYGPTSLERPVTFFPGISSHDDDGGHARLILEETDDELDPGTGPAYVQLAVPQLRASKILGNGGVVVDSYGVINVRAPACGFQFRLLLGDEVRDRIMYVALACQDVTQVAKFYLDTGLFQLGPYPHGRMDPGESALDPDPPKLAKFLQPKGALDDKAAFGILLIPTPKERVFGKNTPPDLGNVYQGIDLLLQDQDLRAQLPPSITDPQGYPLRLL